MSKDVDRWTKEELKNLVRKSIENFVEDALDDIVGSNVENMIDLEITFDFKPDAYPIMKINRYFND